MDQIKVMLEQVSPNELTAINNVGKKSQNNAFNILISTILSQRTRDENTIRASDQLFSKYPTIREIVKADKSEIEDVIKPAGFYRIKAKRIKEVAKIIQRKYGGQVPDTFDELIKLPAVGRKTANCVLVYAFGKPAIPVDTHVHRISNRLGLVDTKTPEETEKELVRKVEKKYWLDMNEIFVRFGQVICRPIKPRCNICTLTNNCIYYKTQYFRK